MSSKDATNAEIEKLAKQLVAGNKKESIAIIRNIASSTDNAYLNGVWKGMERGLQREESDSLIFQLLRGMSKKDATKIFQDLKKKKSEILVRDHTQQDLSKYYIHTWAKLLEFYCENCKD